MLGGHTNISLVKEPQQPIIYARHNRRRMGIVFRHMDPIQVYMQIRRQSRNQEWTMGDVYTRNKSTTLWIGRSYDAQLCYGGVSFKTDTTYHGEEITQRVQWQKFHSMAQNKGELVTHFYQDYVAKLNFASLILNVQMNKFVDSKWIIQKTCSPDRW